MSVSSFIAA